MIKSEHITKFFDDVRSLHDVSLTVGDGSICGLIGSNGSGKSTLLRILTGIYRPDEGSVTCDGIPVYENPAVKARMVYLSDDPYFLPHCTMEDMRGFYGSVYPDFSTERYKELTAAFGLDPRRRIVTFSKGMQKQVSMLLGLACRPGYLFCDETFDGLDPVMRQMVKSLIIDDVAERGMGCLVASHNLREMEDLADHIGLLHRGELLFESELDDMRTGMTKVQISYEKERADAAEAKLAALSPLLLERRGSLFTLILRGPEPVHEAGLRATGPLFYESIPMTLDEIFTIEMEEHGYEGSAQLLG